MAFSEKAEVQWMFDFINKSYMIKALVETADSFFHIYYNLSYPEK